MNRLFSQKEKMVHGQMEILIISKNEIKLHTISPHTCYNYCLKMSINRYIETVGYKINGKFLNY